MNLELYWATPDIDEKIARMARVSNPRNQDNPSIEGLIRYMVRNRHWSPFEMVSACMSIETTRDISRQILRHRSFSFQEFSQRYASTEELPPAGWREVRMQDPGNRQSSVPTSDPDITDWWQDAQADVLIVARDRYASALAMGIAKEQARSLLPEGLTTTRMYMSGTLRSWLHYIEVRADLSTQKEHRDIALAARDALVRVAPVTMSAFMEEA